MSKSAARAARELVATADLLRYMDRKKLSEELEEQDKLLNNPRHNWGYQDALRLSAAAQRAVPVLRAAEQVVEAITNPGRAPLYHVEMVGKLRREWPVLWNAIEEVLKAEGITLAETSEALGDGQG